MVRVGRAAASIRPLLNTLSQGVLTGARLGTGSIGDDVTIGWLGAKRDRGEPAFPAQCWTVGTLGPGSAGATTVAVAVATHVRGVLLEADSDGGVLASRYSGWMDEQAPMLAELLAALPTYGGLAEVMQQLQQLPGGARVALIPPDAEGAVDGVRRLAEDLEHLRHRLSGETLVVDVGRVRPDGASLMLAEQSDALIAVVRPEMESLRCLMARLPAVQEQVPRLLVAVRGEGPYDLADIRAAVARRAGVQIAVVGVPNDPGGVGAWQRGRNAKWSLSGRSSGSLSHSARVLVSLLNGPAPAEEWSPHRYP